VEIELVILEFLEYLCMVWFKMKINFPVAPKVTNLPHGVILFKGMMEFALASVCVSFFSKV
jgi:hypothetical protein